MLPLTTVTVAVRSHAQLVFFPLFCPSTRATAALSRDGWYQGAFQDWQFYDVYGATVSYTSTSTLQTSTGIEITFDFDSAGHDFSAYGLTLLRFGRGPGWHGRRGGLRGFRFAWHSPHERRRCFWASAMTAITARTPKHCYRRRSTRDNGSNTREHQHSNNRRADG